MRRVLPAPVLPAAVLLAVVLLTACSEPAEQPASAPDGRVVGVLDGTKLLLEVADTEEDRAVGLMGRTSVPAGTGMVFRYDQPSEGRFYMYRVPIPLRATFIREGRVVSTVVMPPCPLQDPGACPTYGADGPFDTVVETDPGQAPDPGAGDLFTLQD